MGPHTSLKGLTAQALKASSLFMPLNLSQKPKAKKAKTKPTVLYDGKESCAIPYTVYRDDA